MFDLEPKVDFSEASRQRAQVEYERYDRLMATYESNRVQSSTHPPPEDFIGRFEDHGLKMSLTIHSNGRGSQGEWPLQLIVNDRNTQCHQLFHYYDDKLGFPPSSREELIVREIIDWFRWDQFILDFQRDETGRVSSVKWALQMDIEPVLLMKAD
jgi:hypothetical protein